MKGKSSEAFDLILGLGQAASFLRFGHSDGQLGRVMGLT